MQSDDVVSEAAFINRLTFEDCGADPDQLSVARLVAAMVLTASGFSPEQLSTGLTAKCRPSAAEPDARLIREAQAALRLAELAAASELAAVHRGPMFALRIRDFDLH